MKFNLMIFFLLIFNIGEIQAQVSLYYDPGNSSSTIPAAQYNAIDPTLFKEIFYYTDDYDYPIFADEFNGTSLDIVNNWSSNQFGMNGRLTNNGSVPPGELEYMINPGDDPSYYQVSGGTLKLYNKQVDMWANLTWQSPSTLLSDGFPNRRHFKYATAQIQSNLLFKEGKFEMRCKLPIIDGVWPAFWLYGEKGDSEIDILEFAQNGTGTLCTAESSSSSNNRWFTTYHDYKTFDTIKSEARAFVAQNGLNFQDWHVFGLLWDEYRVSWTLDGVAVRTIYHYFDSNNNPITNYTNYSSLGPYMFINQAFPKDQSTLLIGSAVKNFGGPYGDPTFNGTVDYTCTSSSATFPSYMEVDWVRVYGKKACSSDVNICNINQMPSALSARNITLGGSSSCSVIIDNSRPDLLPQSSRAEKSTCIATTSVQLLPGFIAKTGAHFNAYISSCSTVTNASLRTKQSNFTENGITSNAQTVVETLSNNSTIQIFPNPTTGKVRLEIPSSIITGHITIDDLLGTRVYESSLSGSQDIDLSKYGNGVYILRTNTDGNIKTQKIILNK